MKEPSTRFIDTNIKIGFLCLASTMFLISFPRSWSLYPLGLFLITGLLIWIADFKRVYRSFFGNWYLILPPVLYFIIHLISFLSQDTKINLLEERLMFLLIPLFGYPVFMQDYFKSRFPLLLKLFIFGLLSISVYLLILLVFKCFNNVTDEISLFGYIKMNSSKLFSLDFSVLEHPSYLSLKIVFAMVILIYYSDQLGINKLFKDGMILVFTVTIFMLASKSGIIVWMVIGVILLIRLGKKRSFRPVIYFLIIPSFMILTYISVNRIERIGFFLNSTFKSLSVKEVDWKNLNQRTREWYTAIQLIKEKPVTGIGLGKVEGKMVDMYRENGFIEEADLKLNAHNQYLEAQMTFGIAGTLTLFWMLLTPVFFRKRLEYSLPAISLVLIMSFFLFFESMFNRQWGIMFFLLFYCMLILIPGKNLNNELIAPDNNLL
jgi:O-antigen ligase